MGHTADITLVGIEGIGPFNGAIQVAEEVIKSVNGDAHQAVAKLIKIHTRLAATTGAVTVLGGIATLPVSMPVGSEGTTWWEHGWQLLWHTRADMMCTARMFEQLF